MANSKRYETIAALLVALATAGGLIFSVIQYYTDLRLNSKIQEESYKSLKGSFEEFAGSVKKDLEKMNDDINELKIQVAVSNEAIKNLRRERGERSPASVEPEPPPAPIHTKAMELPEFKSIKETAQVQADSPKM
jgi:hypothetical protein